MPLLRLTGLIIATLLLAALSALAPGQANPHLSLSYQHAAGYRVTDLALATRELPGSPAHRVVSPYPGSHAAELVHVAGQSIPETGQ